MNLRPMNSAIRQPNCGKSPQFPPTALSIEFVQPPAVANATTNCDWLNALDFTDDCEVHCARILTRLPQSGVSTFAPKPHAAAT